MPETGMDLWVIAGVVLAALAVAVAFMRRPKKTTNTITRGSDNTQMGGEGTTTNTITDGDKNHQQG